MSYRRVPNRPVESDDEDEPEAQSNTPSAQLSWRLYGVCTLLGVAMLWAWNMFLAAAPYFQRRFSSNSSILANFQAAEVSVFTLTNLMSMLILAKLQARASYPHRILYSLAIYAVTYTLLAISTKAFNKVSTEGYFAFFIIMVIASSAATGFIQNGTFSYVNGFGRPEYMQGVMVGQAVAGILPPIVQIVTVLSPGAEGQQSSTSALSYFLTAVVVSFLTFLAFLWLMRQFRQKMLKTDNPDEYRDNDAAQGPNHSNSSSRENLAQTHDRHPEHTKQSVPLTRLTRKLFFPGTAIFVVFVITMVFPVFTQRIQSTNPTPPPLLRAAAFIPLAFLVWNIGDLLGRLIPLVPRFSLASKPHILLLLAVLRLLFIPLYLLCNIQPADSAPSSPGAATGGPLPATVKSDWFYLLVVQFPFGLSNGYLGASCMMGSGDCVEEEEREAAGAFMALLLVGGLTVGSLCSFFVGNKI